MMTMRKLFIRLRREEGFALVEVAIALIIMGIVMGVGLPSFLHYLQWQKIRETKEKQEKIFYSVASFVLQNGFLPLSASPHEGGDSFGMSRPSIHNPSDLRGIVPFKTLGLPEDYARDGFNRYFTYIGGSLQKEVVDVSNEASFCQTSPAYLIEVDEHRPHGGYVKRSSEMTDRNPIVLIVLSHGESGYGAYYGVSGNVKQIRGSHKIGDDKRHNASSSLRIISRVSSKRSEDFFDDMVMWVTRDNLMAFYGKAPCQSYEKPRDYGYDFV